MKKFNTYLTISKSDEFEFANTDDSVFITAHNYEEALKTFDDAEEYFEDAYDNECNAVDKNILISDGYQFDVQNIIINDTSDDTLKTFDVFSDTLKNVDFSDLSLDDIASVLAKVKFNDDVVYMTKYNNNEYSSFEDLVGAMEYVNQISDYINQFNFSDLEKCIFLYDLLKEREYKYSEYDLNNEYNAEVEELEIEKKAPSRSLMCVYKSDEIVCAGFAKIYAAVLEKLGIRCEELSFNSDDKAGHASTVVYLNDSKYNEKCIMEVDPTWGRIEDKDGNYLYMDSLLDYSSFGKSITRTAIEKEKMNLKTTGFSQALVEKLLASAIRLNRMDKACAPSIILDGEFKLLLKRMKELKEKYNYDIFVEEITLAQDALNSCEYDSIEKIYNGVLEKFKLTINPRNFYNALLCVKKSENIINSTKYSYTDSNILSAYGTRFSFDRIKDIKLLFAIFGELVPDEGKEFEVNYLENMDLSTNPVMCIKKELKI